GCHGDRWRARWRSSPGQTREAAARGHSQRSGQRVGRRHSVASRRRRRRRDWCRSGLVLGRWDGAVASDGPSDRRGGRFCFGGAVQSWSNLPPPPHRQAHRGAGPLADLASKRRVFGADPIKPSQARHRHDCHPQTNPQTQGHSTQSPHHQAGQHPRQEARASDESSGSGQGQSPGQGSGRAEARGGVQGKSGESRRRRSE
ncbi:unnamed protein product, partial [Ectocarpus fasciculatus]